MTLIIDRPAPTTEHADDALAQLLHYLEREGYAPHVEADARYLGETIVTVSDDVDVLTITHGPDGFDVARYTTNEWDHVWGQPEKAENGLTETQVHEVLDGRHHLPYGDLHHLPYA